MINDTPLADKCWYVGRNSTTAYIHSLIWFARSTKMLIKPMWGNRGITQQMHVRKIQKGGRSITGGSFPTSPCTTYSRAIVCWGVNKSWGGKIEGVVKACDMENNYYLSLSSREETFLELAWKCSWLLFPSFLVQSCKIKKTCHPQSFWLLLIIKALKSLMAS